VLRLGVDIGGTFTDVVAIDPGSGQSATTKVLTTPADPSLAVLQGLGSVLAEFGRQPESISAFIHATTLVTNALIERKGARTALITTRGFRDILEMGREIRYDLYDLNLDKPAPLVERDLRLELSERVLADGSVWTALSEDESRTLARQLREWGIQSVAVSFLHSYVNPRHERVVHDILQSEAPEIDVTVSSSVAPVIREYERTSTTVANAYVMPLVRHYLTQLEGRLQGEGMQVPIRVMLSNGGIVSPSVAKESPIQMLESGPAAGAIAASYFARHVGAERLISFDMGGTTAKICLIDEFEPSHTNVFEAARLQRFKPGSGLPLHVPVVEMIEIGAGGGSVATIDHLGLLTVGPESTGAVPGPACYGLGGVRPTVTDADVLLGFVDSEAFLGGTMRLHRDLAREALASGVASQLGIDSERAAIGVFDVVTNNMAVALRMHAAERGRDYRRYDILAFGGAGPIHAYGLAQVLGMPRIICPVGAGVLSAFGLLVAPSLVQVTRSDVQDLSRFDVTRIARLLAEMEDEAIAQLPREANRAAARRTRSAEVRYVGQGHEVEVALPDGPLPAGDALAHLFRSTYRERFNLELPDSPVEALTWRVTVRVSAPDLFLSRRSPNQVSSPTGSRRVFSPGTRTFVECPVFQRSFMSPRTTLQGPAIIQEPDSAVLIGEGAIGTVDELFNVIVEMPKASARMRRSERPSAYV
jgi:N-methylhydantoinase A